MTTTVPTGPRWRGVRRAVPGLDRALQTAGLQWDSRRNAVIVFSAPKTATTTVARTIALRTDRPVKRVHTRIPVGRLLRPLDRRWWPRDVITLTRDPIARSVSDFFDTGGHLACLDPGTDPAEADLDRLRAAVESHVERDHHSDWFTRLFRASTGLDPFDQPFPSAEGHLVLTGEQCRVLLLRVEDLDQDLEVLAEFLRTPPFTLVDANRAEAKPHAALYRRFLESVRLRREVVESAYARTEVRHFYRETEIDEMRARWAG